MANIVEYVYQLQDRMSNQLSGIAKTAVTVQTNMNRTKASIEGVSKAYGNLSKLLSVAGIGFGMFKMVNMMKEGVEKAQALQQASAQLANTMKNMGNYTDESYKSAIESAGKLSKNMKFGKADIIALQSQLRLVGNIGTEEMDRLAVASADMATKFGMGLEEAGNAIAKSINNPEMMRRLAMQLKIDPHEVEKIQKLAKKGGIKGEQQARMALIDIVEQKVGGSAKAAFDTDPLAKYNKMVGSIKVSMGELALKIQERLAPVLLHIAEKVKEFAQKFIDNFDKIIAVINVVLFPIRLLVNGLFSMVKFFNENRKVLIATIALLGTYRVLLWQSTLATKGLTIAMQLQHYWTLMAERAMKLFNITIIKNPFLALFTVITLVAGALVMFKKRTKEAADEYGKLNAKAKEYASDEKVRLDIIFDRLRRTNPKSKERNDLVKQLNEMYPDVLKNMNLEKAGLQELEIAYNNIVNSIDRKARARASEDRLVDLYKQKDKLVEIRNNPAEPNLLGKMLDNIIEDNPILGAYVKVKREKNKNWDADLGILEIDNLISEINKQIRDEKIGGNSSNLNFSGGSGTSTSISDLTGGGSKATNITINLRNLIEHFNLKTETFKEGVEKGTDELIEGLLRVVNSANRISTQ